MAGAFRKFQGSVLGIGALRGLYGELLALQMAIDQLGATSALNAWRGPKGGKQDFLLDDLALEVKVVLPGASHVRISSIEQLDSAFEDLRLLIIEAERLDVEDQSGLLLKKLCTTISTSLGLPGLRIEFSRLLSSIGYAPEGQPADLNLKVHGMSLFRVVDGFPRLLRRNLDERLFDVAYSLKLADLASFRAQVDGAFQ